MRGCTHNTALSALCHPLSKASNDDRMPFSIGGLPNSHACGEGVRVGRMHHGVARPVLLPQNVGSNGSSSVAPNVAVAVVLVTAEVENSNSNSTVITWAHIRWTAENETKILKS